jgi:uncharacterized protein (DUF2236 family)
MPSTITVGDSAAGVGCLFAPYRQASGIRASLVTDSVYPSAEEARSLAVGPGSVCWARASDVRTLLGAGAALVLQVAHPTVAAGVREHSDFERDPWGRLLRTLDYVNLLVFGGPEAAATTARAVREMHKKIRGVAPDGRRYHALEPEAYAWVHATLALAIVEANRRFGRPFDPADREQLYAEWRGLGRLLGVRERDMPVDWAALTAYTDRMIDERLEDNDVVHSVLRSLDARVPPPDPIGRRAWPLIRPPAAHLQRLATIGLLPERLRRKLGLSLSLPEQAELRAVGAALRATTPVLPESLRVVGPGYLRWRGDAIARGMYGESTTALGTGA